jgi:hypothetical protein
MTRSFSRGLVVAAGLLAVPALANPDPIHVKMIPRADARWILIRQFFEKNNAPADEYAKDFLIAADQNGLDWRLLPSLSLIESGGGKSARNNNIFGWGNCKVRFRTTREGIYQVASRLKNSILYKGKGSVDEMLWTYNPRQEYVQQVIAVMNRLGPVVPVSAGAY